MRDLLGWIREYNVRRTITVGWKWKFWGCKRMKDPGLLNRVQDEVFADKALWPKPGNETSYCNLAALRVAHGVGCHDLDSGAADPLTANSLYFLFQRSEKFLVKPMADCQELVNAGALIFAILPGSKLSQGHGHICTLTPGQATFSGHWNAKAPIAMNLGREGTCFRNKGVNFAFVPQPEFYAWKESL